MAGMRSKSLIKSSLIEGDVEANDDPLSSMGNLMDLMLVFALGIMIALIAHYNVDFSPTGDPKGEIQKLDAELAEASESIGNSDSSFSELGMVYKNLETGDLYVVTSDGASVETSADEDSETPEE